MSDTQEPQQAADSGLPQPRLVRRWWDTDYPIIARLNHNTFDLVAHPNGPALCDGDMMASIDTHPDDSRELMKLKMQAQAAWREYAWPLVKGNFYPTNVKCGGTVAQDSQSEAKEGRCPPLPRTSC